MNALRAANRAQADSVECVYSYIYRSNFRILILFPDEWSKSRIKKNNTHEKITRFHLPCEMWQTLVYPSRSFSPSSWMVLRWSFGWYQAGEQARPSGSAGSGWNECRGSAGRVEKRVRSINQPPPWWTSIPHLSTCGGEHPTTTLLAARALPFPRTRHRDICVCIDPCECAHTILSVI